MVASFCSRVSWIRFEAAATAGFVRTTSSDHDQFVAFDQALGVYGGISAADTDGQQLSDFLRDGQKARHRFERPALVVRVESGDDDTLAQISQLGAHIHDFIAEKLRFVNS